MLAAASNLRSGSQLSRGLKLRNLVGNVARHAMQDPFVLVPSEARTKGDSLTANQQSKSINELNPLQTQNVRLVTFNSTASMCIKLFVS